MSDGVHLQCSLGTVSSADLLRAFNSAHQLVFCLQAHKAPEGLKAEALYQWKARQDNHLSFNKGDIILVKEQEDLWWMGELGGKVHRSSTLTCLLFHLSVPPSVFLHLPLFYIHAFVRFSIFAVFSSVSSLLSPSFILPIFQPFFTFFYCVLSFLLSVFF